MTAGTDETEGRCRAVKNRLQTIRESFRYVKARSVAFALAVLFVTAAVAVFVGLQVRAMRKETLVLKGELNAKEAATEYDRYLLTRVDISLADLPKYVKQAKQLGFIR